MYLSKNLRHSAFLGTGTVVNSLLGLFYYAVVARTLSVSEFGQFSFLLGLGILGADVGSLGFGSTIIKYGSNENFRAFFSTAVFLGVIVSLVYFLLAFFLGLLFPIAFFFSAALAGGAILAYFVSQSLLAKEDYTFYVGTNTAGNVSRLLFLYFLTSYVSVSPHSALAAFILASLVAFLFGLGRIAYKIGGFPLTFEKLGENLHSSWRFTSFLGASFGVAALASRIDIPILFALAGSQVVGIYSTAQKLTSVFPQIAASVEGVFSPKFSKKQGIEKNFREYLVFSVIFCAGLLLLLFLSPAIIPAIFGQKYLSSILVFNLLTIGLVFFVLSGPLTAKLIYYFGRTDLHLVSSAMQLISTLIFYFLLVPSLGARGAAIAFIVSSFAQFLFFVVALKKIER